MKSGIQSVGALLLGALALTSCASRTVKNGDGPRESAAPAVDQPPPLPAKLPGAPGDGMIVQKNEMIPMRDGVRLATDIYRPGGPERVPVVLVRTPYGSETPEFTKQAEYYVRHGYAFAVQDVRGKFDSDGEWYGGRNEAEDGSDAITWLGTRPWSSGSVGMTGPSYMGMVQYLVADQENPYLKALVPLVGPLTLGRDTADYDHLTSYGSRETSSTFEFMWLIGTDGRVGQQDPASTLETARDHLPLSDYPRIIGRKMDWLSFQLTHRYGFWEEYYLRASRGQWSGPLSDLGTWYAGYRERYRKVKVPMFHISGWYDCCGEPPIKNFQLIRELAAEPLARDNQKLMMGPWMHDVGKSKNGALEFGPRALLDPDSVSVRWFDRWLKGLDNGVDQEPPVRVFVMGENRWREATDWPIPGTRFTKYYLRSAGEARLTKGGGRLSTEAPGAEPPDRYTYDPGNPTPARAVDSVPVPFGPADRAGLQRRDDILVYTTDVLRSPVEVTGPLSAVLYASTSAPSTDFLVRLLDVHPNGAAFPVYQIYVTAPYRTHWAKEVEEGPEGSRVIKAEIGLPPTSVAFLPGHRIRVEVSSAYAPVFRGLNVEPGTEPNAVKWNVARQTIYHDQAHPSHVLLPVIPR